MHKKSVSIKHKFLAFALILPTTLAIVFGIIALSGMDKVGEDALNSNYKMSKDISTKSSEVLTKRVMLQALDTATDQAAMSNNIFSNIESLVNILKFETLQRYNNPEYFKAQTSYTYETKPEDIETLFMYKLAPDIALTPEITADIEITSSLQSIVTYLCKTESNIQAIYLGQDNGLFRTYWWKGGNNIPNNYDPRIRSWYNLAVKAKKLIWSELYIDALTKNLIISCCVPFYDIDNDLIGVIGVDVLLNDINDRIISTQLGSTGHAFLLDGKGRLIAGEGISAQGKRWDDTLDTKSIANSDDKGMTQVFEDMCEHKAGVRVCNTKRFGEIVVAHAPLKNLGWSLGIIKPIKEIIEPTKALEQMIKDNTNKSEKIISKSIVNSAYELTIIFIIVIIVAILLAIRFSNRITKPILQLNKDVRLIGKGDFDQKLDVDTADEIQELATSFNQMTSDLKKHISNLQTVTAEKEKISSELTIAKEIQHSILPKIFPPFPKRSGLDIFASLDSAKEVGGDLYDFVLLDEDHLYICIGDVSGKGVPASLFMAVGKTLLKSTIQTIQNPAKALFHVNNELASGNDACMFITLFCGIFNLKTSELTYANSGHNPPIVITGDNATYMDFAKAPPLAIMEDIEFQNEVIKLEHGSKLLLYTDGVTEAMNNENELYGEERLKAFVESTHSKTAEKCIRTISKDITTFVEGAEQSDDITMICFSYISTDDMPDDPLSPTTTIILSSHLQEMARLVTWTDEIGTKLSWSPELLSQVHLIFEEWIVNVISYAFPDTETPHEIEVSLWQDESSIRIEIADDGIPFDPTIISTPDISVPLEEREIGGLGIHFIRSTTNSFTYTREEDRNIITLTKTI